MPPPMTVRQATVLWATAVVCGAIESALAVLQAAGAGSLGPDMLPQLGFRLAVYLLAAVLIVGFRRGRRWARAALTVLLTVFGLASMLVPAVLEMAGGTAFLQAFGGGGALGWAFVLVRLAHIACVIAASVLMFRRSANRYFARPPGDSGMATT